MSYFSTFIPVLVSFCVSVILCPVLIPLLKKLKFGQFIREDGPGTHLKKAGTPTMGGVIILMATLITVILFWDHEKETLLVLFATLGFGAVGFLDDFIKIVMKRSMGLTAWQKLILQLGIAVVFVVCYLKVLHLKPEILLPFSGGIRSGCYLLMPTGMFILFVLLVMLGTVNGTNFTDGLDGLATSITLLVAVFFLMVSVEVCSGLVPVASAVSGALMGFLLYNVYPARVFMGDTGSLALGGFVSSAALILKLPAFIPIVGMIYLVEVLSVILQVGWFKLTGGKRLFLMAPIHHHFEQAGWSETRVVTVFSVITALMCLVAFAGL
ncbi:MAG: phospho-N-acetylmuramoyl-pentapeptide-transferase [Clostridiaceae bacterium]|nr:phospho-N-acetylmuramoyl-pentapeptide-transferase [Clostridiaceae bacterium]